MGKKNMTKSAEQRLRLEGFFERRQGSWQREEILAISRAAGLTRQQVYKWLWDRKRSERQTDQLHPHANTSHGRWVYYGDYRVQVPSEKEQAEVFFVHPSVSVWALLVLRSEGWQLIRDGSADRLPSILPAPIRTSPHTRLRTPKEPALSKPSKMEEEEIYEPEP